MRRHGLLTYDDALRHMRVALEGQGQDAVARAAEPQAPRDAEQPAKKQKLEQLISWASFEDHDEILTYLTGLGKDEREWLVAKLEKAVCVVLCCRLVPSACCGGSKSLTNLYSSPSLMSDQRNVVDPTLGGGGWMQWIAC
jgi:hypothetical protein